MKLCGTFLIFLLGSAPCFTQAALGGRLLGSVTHTDAKDMNGFLNSQNLTDVKRFPGFGLEINSGSGDGIPVELGIRANYQYLHVGRSGDPSGNDYTKLSAWNLPIIARFYLSDRRFFRFDVFGGAGPSWSMLETHAGGVQSQYGIAGGDLRFTTLAGLSAHIGFDFVYLMIEAGYQWNKHGSLTYNWKPATGAMNTLDLSGPFISIGFSFRLSRPSEDRFVSNEIRRERRARGPAAQAKNPAPSRPPEDSLRPMPGVNPSGNNDSQPSDEISP